MNLVLTNDSIEAFTKFFYQKGIQPIEDMIAEDDSSNYEDISERNDTLSTAPTVLMGFNESEDRMLDVRYSNSGENVSKVGTQN